MKPYSLLSLTPLLAALTACYGSSIADSQAPNKTQPTTETGPTLTLALDGTLDGDDGDVKAATITSADLLDPTGAKLKGATITSGQAVFSLAGLLAGDYFIKVNGDADDLVPTRLDVPTTQSTTQTVGQKLRASLIGPAGSPVYRINTYPAGQGIGSVVRFSDGTAIASEQPYVILTMSSGKVEFKVLGTSAPLCSQTTMAVHPSNSAPFDSWILNTPGQPHHGDAFNADPQSCQACHMNMDMKPMMFAAISVTGGGSCFHCHYGSTGTDSGFIDPAK